MEIAIALDTIIFMVTNILFLFWILKKRFSIKTKLFILLIFLVFNSSYNIMVKNIHDYNKSIPRNFIWTKDVVSSFSVFDVITIVFLSLNMVYLVKIIKNDPFIRMQYKRDFTIIVLGTISFILFRGYWLDGGKNYLLAIKGLIYFSASLIATIKYLNVEFKLKDYLTPTLIILFSGYFSLQFFPDKELWVRYGQIVKIIDQDDAYTISLFIITFLTIYLFFPKKDRRVSMSVLLTFIIVFLQNLLSIYKTNFIYFIYLFLLIPCIRLTRKIFIKWFTTLIILLICLLFGLAMIINLSTSQSVETRISQLSDYFTYINENYKGAYFIGSGIGTPYLSLTQTEDLGETKIVDLENSDNNLYKFTFQVPVLFIFKYAGLIGLIWFLTFWFLLVIKVVNDIRKMRYSNINILSKVEFISIGLYLMFFSIFWGSVMLGGTTPIYIFLGLLIGRYIILRRKIYYETYRTKG